MGSLPVRQHADCRPLKKGRHLLIIQVTIVEFEEAGMFPETGFQLRGQASGAGDRKADASVQEKRRLRQQIEPLVRLEPAKKESERLAPRCLFTAPGA